MLRTVLLLPLTLWFTSTHAFFPSDPEWHKLIEPEPAPEARGVHTYKVTQRARPDYRDPAASAAREAGRLLRKTRPSRTTPGQPDLTRRGTNAYHVVTPLPPSTPHSAGIYQDGTDFSYFLPVEFGTGADPLYMLLDTGAGTTWVPGPDCKSDACAMHNSFGPADSKTFQATKNTFSISYGSGKVSGILAKDTLSLAGLTVPMTFGVANDTSGDFKSFPFDGILGLSMARAATDNFLDVVKTNKLLASNIFSVSLSRNSDGPNTGEITFGGIDSSRYTGQITYTPVAASAGGDWAIPMDDIAYDGKNAGLKNRLAYIDTGTSYSFGPPEDVAALHKLIPGAKSDNGFDYTVPCDSDKILTISFSGVAYTVSPKDWMSPPVNGVCASTFYGQAVVQGAWLFGDAFLKNVYTVFDVDQTRIGFAAKPAPPPSATSSSSQSSSSSSSSSSSIQPPTASNGSSSSKPPTTTTPADSSSSSSSPAGMPGLSGHETAAAQGTPPAAQTQTTGAPATTPTGVISPGEQLEGNRYASIICIVAVIAMVA